MNKRGLSMIITTLILIVLVLVAVGIIWVVVNNILKGGTEGIALGKFTLDAGIKNVNIDNSSNNVSLTVKRNPGKGELSGMKFIFYDGTNSEIVTEENMTLKELGSRRFNFHLININVDNLIRISIVPIFKSDSGKEIMGNVVDTYNVKDGVGCIANCTNKECGSDGCGGICGDCVILYGAGWYCQDGTCIEGVNPCQLTSASWNETNVVEGTLVSLNVIGTNCAGIDLNYTIWEDDALLNPDDFADSFIATGLGTTWIAEWQDDTDGGQSNPPEYYFIVRVVGETEEVTSSAPLLEVTQAASCTPNTCASLGYECGTHANGTCAGTLDCNNPGCGIHSTCPSGTCVCDSGWGDCNNDNSCDCDLSLNSCVGGSCVVVSGDIIPSERIIDWSNVGVEGGIPIRTIIRNCVTSDGAHADGIDTSTEIQACIDNIVLGEVAYLPAGEYTIGSTITLMSYKTLRGAGPESTMLLADDISSIVLIGASRSSPSAINIISGYTKGSNELVLEDASTIDIGSYVRIDELNDPIIPVTQVGVGTCTWCGRENGERVRGQFVKVTAKNGNIITITPEMYYTFSVANIPQVQSLNYGIGAEYSGVEDLTIKNNLRSSKIQGTDGREYSAIRTHTSSSDGSDRPVTGDWRYYWVETGEDGSLHPLWQPSTSYNGDYSTTRIPLNIMNSANCWAKNIKIDMCGSRCIQLFYNNYKFELRDSIISKCINRWDSNNCYGTLIGSHTSGVLIENNIYEFVADGPMFAWSASGNVVGYNYMYDNHRTNVYTTWFLGSGGSHHGAHTSFNLWEGNILEAIYFDQYWGSHSHNTLFRNRIIGKYMVEGIGVDNIRSVYVVSTERNVHYQNYLGNILGTSDYHDTYELNSEGCPNNLYEKLIYRTGYFSSGSCSTDDDDPETFNTMLRHMNYDYFTNSVKYCGDAGEPGCQGSDGSTNLPSSLYLSSKPAFFGSTSWPPIGSDLFPMATDIPAKQRFDARNP